MGKNSKQIQKAGDASLNIQAGQIHISKGLSYEDVKTIALDVFKSNFYQLAGVAKDTARKRAEEITDKFLADLMTRNPEGLQNVEDPDFQYAMFTAQKAYARTGDKELGDILVDILVDRTKEPNRSILQIVLTESLEIAPKLTRNQLDALSIIFSLKYTRYLKMGNINALRHYLDYRISPFVEGITKSDTCYQHLEYAGCGSIEITSVSIETIFLEHYPGIFVKGFPESDIKEIIDENALSHQMLIRCLRNPQLLQVNAIDADTIRSKSEKIGLEGAKVEKLIELQNKHRMSETEVKDDLRSAHSCMEKLFGIWEGSFMKNMTLTSVGIAIGHANTRRVTKETDDLSIWIN
jgi:hypothetical protein